MAGLDPRASVAKQEAAFNEAVGRIKSCYDSGTQTLSLGMAALRQLPNLELLDGLLNLDLEWSAVSNLEALADLHSLRSLSLIGSPVSDISPLRSLRSLRSLNLAHTKVLDLRPLADLTELSSLDLSNTKIEDISALAGLKSLSKLCLWLAPVSDISAVSGLRRLRSLDIRQTRVSDLSPLAHLTELVAEAKRDPAGGGLAIRGCPILDGALSTYLADRNPKRTINTISYLRYQQGLDPLPNEVLDSLPPVPRQGPGPHFALRDDGIIDFVPPEALDQRGNNVARLRELHPILQDLATKLATGLGRGNIPHAELHRRVRA